MFARGWVRGSLLCALVLSGQPACSGKKEAPKEEDSTTSNRSEPSSSASARSRSAEAKEDAKPAASIALPERYKPYKSDAGGYEVRMPGEPFLNTEKTPEGYQINKAMVLKGDVGVQVWFHDQTDPPDVKKMAEDLAKKLSGGAARETKVQGLDGYEITGKVKGKIPVRARLFAKKNRVFQLIAGTLPDEEAIAWMETFRFSGS